MKIPYGIQVTAIGIKLHDGKSKLSASFKVEGSIIGLHVINITCMDMLYYSKYNVSCEVDVLTVTCNLCLSPQSYTFVLKLIITYEKYLVFH